MPRALDDSSTGYSSLAHLLLVEGRCDLAQGYLFARPLEAVDVSLLLVSAAARTGA